MCKFRISAHRLPIESGRYLKIERVNRKCIECNKVGDEMHYFLDCNEQQISTCRQTLFHYGFTDSLLQVNTKVTVILLSGVCL